MVIAILAAMLLPALAAAKSRAFKIQCISNLKQNMLGCTLFASDYDDQLPYPSDLSGAPYQPSVSHLSYDARSSWVETFSPHSELAFFIAPFLANARTTVNPNISENKLMICPAYVHNPQYAARAPTATDVHDQRRMYRLRQYVEGKSLWFTTSPKLGQIQQPSSNGAMADEDLAFPGGSSSTMGAGWSQLPDQPVHGRARNYGFFDGHIDSFWSNTNSASGHLSSMTTGVQPYGWVLRTQ